MSRDRLRKKKGSSGRRAAAALLLVMAFFLTACGGGENPGAAADIQALLAAERAEILDRGLVAIKTDEGIYLSWRLDRSEDAVYGEADENVVFTVLRDGEAIAEVASSTNYLDTEGTEESLYEVAPFAGADSRGDGETDAGAAFGGNAARVLADNYFDIPLERPADSPAGTYTINDVSPGDLDGDGSYDLVVKWDSGGLDNALDGFTGNVLIDAYRLDGTPIWEKPIDLGPNIRAGDHYTQVLVYDFDRDGRAEVMMKTAPGSSDAAGQFVSEMSLEKTILAVDNSADLRNDDGHILEGDELLTVFDGQTGEALDTIYYPNQRVDPEIWGDDKGNRCDRFTAAVAYLDGQKPFGVFMRGYYPGRAGKSGRQAACGVAFDGERLSCPYSFDTFDVKKYPGRAASDSYYKDGAYKGVAGYQKGNEIYVGEGNHNAAAADVDGDGRDEVLTGALCYEVDEDDRLSVKWCTFLGHGDAMHLADYDPEHEGYELLAVHEDGGEDSLNQAADESGQPESGRGAIRDFGVSVIDAATGEILCHAGAEKDTGRGLMADVGAGGYYQFWAARGAGFNPTGELLPRVCFGGDDFDSVEIRGISTNFRIFWDGDLYDELLDGPDGGPLVVTDFVPDPALSSNGGDRISGKMVPLFETVGCTSINGSKANPCLMADLLGDWREEIVMARDDNEVLRVYVSDIPTEYKMMSLMQDPLYRLGVAAEQTGYDQPPHVGFPVRSSHDYTS